MNYKQILSVNYKQIIALVVIVIGIAAIIYAVHSMHRIKEAKEDVHGIISILPEDVIIDIVGGELKSESSQYDTEVRWLLIGGIALVVLGGGAVIVLRTKKKS